MEATSILRKNYNGGKNRYNSSGGMVEGGGQREKMATRGKRLVKERGTSEKRVKTRGGRNGGLRSANSSTTRRLAAGQTGGPWRAISSFILINNACQESGRVGGKPWSRKQFHRLLYDSNGDALFPSLKARSYPAQRRGGGGGGERRIKKKFFSSTEQRMISAAAVDYRQGNYFRWNGEAKERKRIEQPPIPAHLVIR